MSDFDPTKPCQLRNGTPVRILCTDGPGDMPLVIMREDGAVSKRYANGKFIRGDSGEFDLDLVNVPERIVRFVNVYPKDGSTGTCFKTLFSAKAIGEYERRAGRHSVVYRMVFEGDKVVEFVPVEC